MIAVVDYGVGNVRAFLNAYKQLNVPARAARVPSDFQGATKLILPGVGHFDHAMKRLNESGLRPALDDMVLGSRVPVLGICVGMQMLAPASDEGELAGLGWIPGHVRSFSSWEATQRLPQPHMGWNDVRPSPANRLFAQLESDARFYFLHSYFFEAATREHICARAEYGAEFCAAVSHGNIHGVQFHPEKSHHFGTRLLKNFAEL